MRIMLAELSRSCLAEFIGMGLDFGGSGLSAPVKIYESQVEDQGQYVALNYCWGGPRDIQLNYMNRCKFNQTLPFSMLLQSIQGAIKITRGLEIQCLWIDALCIIQDRLTGKITEINARVRYIGMQLWQSLRLTAQTRGIDFYETFFPSCLVECRCFSRMVV